jgi:hypothetical protein
LFSQPDHGGHEMVMHSYGVNMDMDLVQLISFGFRIKFPHVTAAAAAAVCNQSKSDWKV